MKTYLKKKLYNTILKIITVNGMSIIMLCKNKIFIWILKVCICLGLVLKIAFKLSLLPYPL